MKYFALTIFAFFVCCITYSINGDEFPVLTEPYLGQHASSIRATVFAPDIVSTSDTEILYGFLDDGRQLVFERIVDDPQKGRSGSVFIMTLIDGRWTAAVKSEYPPDRWYYNFTTLHEGEELLIGVERPKSNPNSRYAIDLHSVQKQQKGWSEPELLKINNDGIDTWPTKAKNGNVYFFSNRNGQHDIYRTGKTEGEYMQPVNLGEIINSEFNETDPQISANDSYLVFSSNREDSLGAYDLYVSFIKDNGQWGIPINLGPAVNSKDDDERPYLTSDGKYLFFSREVKKQLELYWISTEHIHNLKTRGSE
jgi:hypothetical protein